MTVNEGGEKGSDKQHSDIKQHSFCFFDLKGWSSDKLHIWLHLSSSSLPENIRWIVDLSHLKWRYKKTGEVKLSGINVGRERDKPQFPSSTSVPSPEDTTWRTDVPQHQTPTLTASTLLHRNPHQQPAACGRLTTHLTLTLPQLCSNSSLDVAAWEGENSRFVLLSQLFLKTLWVMS